MIINGGSRAGAGELAAHLTRSDTNESVEVLEICGLATGTLREALRQMEGIAAGTRCRKSLYHANIDPDPGEAALSAAQQWHAIDRLEQRLRLHGHPRVVVAHLKHGRAHLHVVWSRIDQATMKAVHDGHNYRIHEAVARELEREFGHRRIQGAHEEREAHLRPARTPPADELRQAARTAVDPKALTVEITRLWQASDSGRAFQAALAAAGYQLARGARRDFVLIDRTGGVHSLARRVTGARAADIRAKLADLVAEMLPSVEAARTIARARLAKRGDSRPVAGRSAPFTARSPRQPGPAAPGAPQTAIGWGRTAGKARTGTTEAENRRSTSLPFPLLGGPKRSAADQSPGNRSQRTTSRAGARPAPVGTPLRAAALPAIRIRRPNQAPMLMASPAIFRMSLPERPSATAGVIGGFGAASPAPIKAGHREARPIIKFCRTLGVDPPYEVVMWALKQKKKLIAYSCATGEDVNAQLAHLNKIISGAYLAEGLTATGKQRSSSAPAPSPP